MRSCWLRRFLRRHRVPRGCPGRAGRRAGRHRAKLRLQRLELPPVGRASPARRAAARPGRQQPGNFSALGPYLASQGFCTFAPTYGEAIPGVPVGGIAPVPGPPPRWAHFIGQVRTATGAARVDLVGHSEGGFQALYGPKFIPGEAAAVARVVALAPPTHGTTFASLVTIGDDLGISPLTGAVIAAGCPACSELTTGSSLVSSLNAGPVAQPGIAYTVIASARDELVTPYGTESVSEPGVSNETVQDFCPSTQSGTSAWPTTPTSRNSSQRPRSRQPGTADLQHGPRLLTTTRKRRPHSLTRSSTEPHGKVKTTPKAPAAREKASWRRHDGRHADRPGSGRRRQALTPPTGL